MLKKLLLAVNFLVLSSVAIADRFWTDELQDWRLYFNNGVVYVTSTSFPEQCNHNRAQMSIDGDAYKNAMFSYILAASKSGDKLKVVLDIDRSQGPDTYTCVLLSAMAYK